MYKILLLSFVLLSSCATVHRVNQPLSECLSNLGNPKPYQEYPGYSLKRLNGIELHSRTKGGNYLGQNIINYNESNKKGGKEISYYNWNERRAFNDVMLSPEKVKITLLKIEGNRTEVKVRCDDKNPFYTVRNRRRGPRKNFSVK